MLAAALGPCKVRLGPESALTGSGPFSFYVLFRKCVVLVIWEIKNPGSCEAGFVECFCENFYEVLASIVSVASIIPNENHPDTRARLRRQSVFVIG